MICVCRLPGPRNGLDHLDIRLWMSGGLGTLRGKLLGKCFHFKNNFFNFYYTKDTSIAYKIHIRENYSQVLKELWTTTSIIHFKNNFFNFYYIKDTSIVHKRHIQENYNQVPKELWTTTSITHTYIYIYITF